MDCQKKLKELREKMGVNRRQFCDYYLIPYRTVADWEAGKRRIPEYLLRLMMYKAEIEKAKEDGRMNENKTYDIETTTPVVNESVTCKTEKLYTLEDYLALPEDQRVELIDGVFYEMLAPSTVHQGIAGFVYGEFSNYVAFHEGKCFPMISPVDVQLDMDDKTIVEPDVLIVCDRSKINQARVYGAPDFVLEVLSPSTRKKDMQLKLMKYGNAGVREYWMIDPDKKLLVQYDLEQMAMPVVYSFQDKVPVLIWSGKCQIDLKKMYDTLSFLWECE